MYQGSSGDLIDERTNQKRKIWKLIGKLHIQVLMASSTVASILFCYIFKTEEFLQLCYVYLSKKKIIPKCCFVPSKSSNDEYIRQSQSSCAGKISDKSNLIFYNKNFPSLVNITIYYIRNKLKKRYKSIEYYTYKVRIQNFVVKQYKHHELFITGLREKV